MTTDGSEDTFGDIKSLSLTLDELVNVNDITIQGLDNAVLMPNLTYGGATSLHLELSDKKDLTLDVLGMNGMLMYHETIESAIGNQSLDLNVNNLPAGKYQVVISDAKGGKVVLDWIVSK